jgi:hypothetical protein
MLSSTDDAISVRDTFPIGGVSVWPGVAAGAMAQGGVIVSPGDAHGGVIVSPAKAERPSRHVKPMVALSFFKDFILSP